MSQARKPTSHATIAPARTLPGDSGLGAVLLQIVLTVPLAVVLAQAIAARVLANLDRYWDGLRLTPVFALTKGYPLYPSIDQGPLLSFCYGPVSALAYLPTTLATTPTQALLIAAGITLTISLLPIAWLSFRPGGAGPLGFLAFGFAMLVSQPLSYSLFSPVHDAVALSCGMVACLLLVSPRERLPRAQLILSGIFLALGVWSKQNAIFLAPALFGYLWALRGRSDAFVYGGIVAAAGLILGVGFSIAFGFEGLKFNLLDIPSRHDIQSSWGESVLVLLQHAAPFLFMLLVATALHLIPIKDRRRWLGDPAAILLLASVAMIPIALLGYRKHGGWLNTLSFSIYYLAAAILALFVPADMLSPARRRAILGIVGLLALGLGVGVSLTADTLDWKKLRDNPHEVAFRFARQNPGVVYFPWNGLSTLLADGHLDHVEDGFMSAEKMAGFAIPDAVVRAHLPRAARFIAYPPGFNETSWGNLYMRKYLPGPEARRPVEGLRDWLIFEIRRAPGIRGESVL